MQLPDGVTIGPSTQIPRHDGEVVQGWLIQCNLLKDGISYKATYEYSSPPAEQFTMEAFDSLGTYVADLIMRLYDDQGLYEACLGQMPR